MLVFSIDFLKFVKRYSRIGATFVVAMTLLTHVGDALAQNQ